MTNPKTYIRRPNRYKYHVRIGATRTRPMSSVTEFASRLELCASCIMFWHGILSARIFA